MLCAKCQANQAKIHLHLNVNGQKQTLPLCQDCYIQEKEKLGASMGNPFNGFGGLEDLFDNFSQNNQSHSQQAAKTSTKQNGFLDQFGRNLNHAAKAGLIDPIIGRDEEIKRTIEILNRRNKNNPVLIGEPGVGKTAIAEGLALKIIQQDVPAKLKNKEVYLLDVASLVANTGIRGQFEERMKQLITELQERKNILVFIDEIHLLVGAGSAEGSMDAGNILKPVLARGELQVIGATTLKEYRQIEKDAALERRFQPVQIQEPSLEKSLDILFGLKEQYEKYHQVQYSDEALKACVDLSARYIQDRYLPDKAIDLMDEAGSKLNLTIKDESHEAIHQRLAEIEKDKQTTLKQENYELAAKLRDEEVELEHKLNTTTSSESQLTVHPEDIQSIIERKTGIPVGKLQSDEQQKMKELEKNLTARVIGQAEAVKKVAKAIRRSRAGLKDEYRPIGSFLFVGPTGVGKTELAKTLTEELFGTKEAFIRLDMSEYMEKHSVSKLIGSPPGYVGHDEAGQLTEKVRRNPYSIILLDEIEKAHPDVQHMFLQILEDGRLTDSQGRTVSFKDTVIIMTSNAGITEKPIHVGFHQSAAMKETSILQSLGSFFKPEFLNRFDSIVEFNLLEKNDLLQIIQLLLDELQHKLHAQDMHLDIADEVKEKLLEVGYHPDFGARPLRRAIQEQLEDQIADFVLDHNHEKHLNAIVEDQKITIVSQSHE
ncbi:ATP-dependent Clp protease ATP-binding subunit ClpE [Bacillus sp. J14TS2]|uniref:ATP-dependent Clp protease ATP-binding subunit n=1 Tax=Bacillus sp. J14TS2 TaxID=2807188 RepID=UPI001B2EB506|nr:ATP-dependent Clp protease ATP-binding subunit [Bacillus sp. J14TS2]GIN74163.1 ATP-dependent Clp protease ATP-binding subunit ClpE [Bacillus sp. J14TS2]